MDHILCWWFVHLTTFELWLVLAGNHSSSFFATWFCTRIRFFLVVLILTACLLGLIREDTICVSLLLCITRLSLPTLLYGLTRSGRSYAPNFCISLFFNLLMENKVNKFVQPLLLS